MTTLFNQLDDLLTVGFTTTEQLDQYRELKALYEEETHDYSFSARELMGQLERILDKRDFPNIEQGYKEEYLELIKQLEYYDSIKANYYLNFLKK